MIKGYKVFRPDWSCRGKIYTCPGKFEEERAFPSSEILQGRLSVITYDAKSRQKWWDRLNSRQKYAILSLPNFDKDIFYEITGIDVTQGEE